MFCSIFTFFLDLFPFPQSTCISLFSVFQLAPLILIKALHIQTFIHFHNGLQIALASLFASPITFFPLTCSHLLPYTLSYHSSSNYTSTIHRHMLTNIQIFTNIYLLHLDKTLFVRKPYITNLRESVLLIERKNTYHLQKISKTGKLRWRKDF